MKKLIFFFTVGIAVACNTSQTEKLTETKEPAAEATPNYPYKIDKPDNWDIGSKANTLTALSALKAWETGKIDESLSYFGDSVVVQFDGLDKKVPKDTLKAMFSGLRSSFKTMEIKMRDWESVISKDKSQEWVTLWYTEHWETPDGKKDSIFHVNDLLIKDGKIIEMAEYSRKFH